LWAIVGRRGGKSRASSILAAFIGELCKHTGLALGERGKVLVLAQNKEQAAVAFGYVAGLFDHVPMLSQLVTNRTAESIALANGIDVEVRSASFRGIRGVMAVAVIGDEAAFWYDDSTGSTNSDAEILNAVRPALATTGSSRRLTRRPARSIGPSERTTAPLAIRASSLFRAPRATSTRACRRPLSIARSPAIPRRRRPNISASSGPTWPASSRATRLTLAWFPAESNSRSCPA
jgi:hypothetical protein